MHMSSPTVFLIPSRQLVKPTTGVLQVRDGEPDGHVHLLVGLQIQR